jgi:DNA topoisomerase-1
MQKKLIIVESPSKCVKIEKYLNFEYNCIATYGHIQKLEFDDIGIDPEQNAGKRVSVKYTTIKNKQYAYLKRAIKNSSEVIIACDTDREGESIGAHVCWVFGLNIETTKRIRFNEITKSAICAAIQSPSNIDMGIVRAQQARQIIDLLIGYKVSPTLWTHIDTNANPNDVNNNISYFNPSNFVKGKKNNDSLSAGRCQTPALRIIYDNYIKIKKQKENIGAICYGVSGLFTQFDYPYKLSKTFDDCMQVEDFLNTEHTFQHQLSRFEKKTVCQLPPSPLTTSRLIQLSSNTFQYSPKKTMELCQTLYEEGYITYMRTESDKYSREFILQAANKIRKTYCSQLISKSFIDETHLESITATETSHEAHEAIRPTNININKLTQNSTILQAHTKLYALIYQTTMESCLPPTQGWAIQSQITSNTNAVYTSECCQIVFPGWKIVPERNIVLNKENNEQSPMFQYLLNLPIGENISTQYSSISTSLSIDSGIGHLTEARLVNMLESLYIGRPSTFSSLVEKIQLRSYVKRTNIIGTKLNGNQYELIPTESNFLSKSLISKVLGGEKNKLVIQPLGIKVIEFLINNFSLFEYTYTSDMEKMLDTISNKTKCKNIDPYIQLEDVCILCNNSTMKQIDKLKKLETKIRKITKNKIRPIAVYNGYAVSVRNGKYGLFAKMTAVQTESNLKPEYINSVKKTASDYTVSLKTLKTKKPPEDICWEEIEYIVRAKSAKKS